MLVSSIVHKFKYHYYSKLRNTQLFLIFFCINHRIKNNEKIIKIDDKLIFTFLKHIQKYKNYQPISIFKNLNNKFHFIIQEVVEAPFDFINNKSKSSNINIQYDRYFYFNNTNKSVNKKILKNNIIFDNTLFQNTSHIQLIFYQNNKWKNYYILEKNIYINNDFEYKGQKQYQKIVKHYCLIIHQDYLNEYLINFEKENLIYIPNLQKNIDKISNF